MGRINNTLRLTTLIFILQLQATACSPIANQTTPKLPPGFVDVMVPINNINGYFYMQHKDSTIDVPTKLFNDRKSQMETLERSIPMPNSIESKSIALSIGPDLDSFAAKLEFPDPEFAEIMLKLLSPKSNFNNWKADNFVNVVHGSDEWTNAIRNTLVSGDVLPIAKAYPKAWALFHVLPENPRGQPIAAGFMNMSNVSMGSTGTIFGLDLRNFHQVFSTINATDMAFIFYAHDQISLSRSLEPDYLKENGINAVFVTRSTYPGFVLGFFLDKLSSRVGLQGILLFNGTKVFYSNFNGMHLIVKAIGNTVFMVVAPTKHSAETLITNVLHPHI